MRTNILFDMLNVELIADQLSSSTKPKPKNKTGLLKRYSGRKLYWHEKQQLPSALCQQTIRLKKIPAIDGSKN